MAFFVNYDLRFFAVSKALLMAWVLSSVQKLDQISEAIWIRPETVAAGLLVLLYVVPKLVLVLVFSHAHETLLPAENNLALREVCMPNEAARFEIDLGLQGLGSQKAEIRRSGRYYIPVIFAAIVP